MKYNRDKLLPAEIKILGIPYQVIYCKKAKDVAGNDTTYWGLHDGITRKIRIFDDGTRPVEDVFRVLLHEIFHAISSIFRMNFGKGKEEVLDLFAIALNDILFSTFFSKRRKI